MKPKNLKNSGNPGNPMNGVLWARRMAYLCILLAALTGQIFDVGWIFHYTFILTLCIPLLSLLLSLPGIIGLRVNMSPSAHEIMRNGSANWTLSVSNRFGLPVACVTGRVRRRCVFTGEESVFLAVLRGAPPGASASWNADTRHCGLMVCTADRIRVWDCLGLFALPLPKQKASGTLLVVPAPENPGQIRLPEGAGVSEPALRGRAAVGEDYELRPYRAGDSLRSIHWKMSAKRDELVTRERLAERRPLPVLTFDHFGEQADMDRILDKLAGFSQTLLEQGRAHEIRWAEPLSGTVRRHAIGGGEDWLTCLTAVLSDPVPPEGASIGAVRAGRQDETLFQIHVKL